MFGFLPVIVHHGYKVGFHFNFVYPHGFECEVLCRLYLPHSKINARCASVSGESC
jgi:hypothetical protein